MKKCPYCKADIEENARFCFYCMTSLEEKETVATPVLKKKYWAVVIAALFIVALAGGGLLWMFGKKEPEQPPVSEDQSAVGGTLTDGREDETEGLPGLQTPGEVGGSDQPVNTPSEERPEHSDSSSSSDGKESVNTNNSGPSDNTNGGTSSGSTNSSTSSGGTNSSTSSGGTNSSTSSGGTNSSTSSGGTNSSTSSGGTNSSPSSGSTNSGTASGDEQTAPAIKPEETTPSAPSDPSEEKPEATVPDDPEESKPENSGGTEAMPSSGATYEYRAARYGDDYHVNAYVEDCVVITGVKTPAEDGIYRIPSTLDGKKVLAVISLAFSDEAIRDTVKTVYLPASLRTVHDHAFAQCRNLTDIYFEGDSIYVSTYAFVDKEKRNGTLTIHCSYNCSNRDLRYYRNIAGSYYDAEWSEI